MSEEFKDDYDLLDDKSTGLYEEDKTKGLDELIEEARKLELTRPNTPDEMIEDTEFKPGSSSSLPPPEPIKRSPLGIEIPVPKIVQKVYNPYKSPKFSQYGSSGSNIFPIITRPAADPLPPVSGGTSVASAFGGPSHPFAADLTISGSIYAKSLVVEDLEADNVLVHDDLHVEGTTELDMGATMPQITSPGDFVVTTTGPTAVVNFITTGIELNGNSIIPPTLYVPNPPIFCRTQEPPGGIITSTQTYSYTLAGITLSQGLTVSPTVPPGLGTIAVLTTGSYMMNLTFNGNSDFGCSQGIRFTAYRNAVAMTNEGLQVVAQMPASPDGSNTSVTLCSIAHLAAGEFLTFDAVSIAGNLGAYTVANAIFNIFCVSLDVPGP
jgi:hypothetical protein